MTKRAITAPGASAVGPYSHGVRAGTLVFVSGQTPLDNKTGKLVPGGVDAQTRQSLVNVGAVLEAAGLGFADVVKATVFLTDMADFAAMNAVYREFFSEPYPARSAVAVAGLPLEARVEIEVIARSAA